MGTGRLANQQYVLGVCQKCRKYSYSPSEAKKLLKSTHLATTSAELTLSTFPAYLDVAQQIAAAWTALGVTTKVQVESAVPADFGESQIAQDVPLIRINIHFGIQRKHRQT